MIGDEKICKCGHDIDYHDENGCYYGSCKCDRRVYISYEEMLYGDRGITWP